MIYQSKIIFLVAEKEHRRSQQLLPVRAILRGGDAYESRREGAFEIAAEQFKDLQRRPRRLRSNVLPERSRERAGRVVSECDDGEQRISSPRRRVLQFGLRRPYTANRPRAAETAGHLSFTQFSPTCEPSSNDILRRTRRDRESRTMPSPRKKGRHLLWKSSFIENNGRRFLTNFYPFCLAEM